MATLYLEGDSDFDNLNMNTQLDSNLILDLEHNDYTVQLVDATATLNIPTGGLISYTVPNNQTITFGLSLTGPPALETVVTVSAGTYSSTYAFHSALTSAVNLIPVNQYDNYVGLGADVEFYSIADGNRQISKIESLGVDSDHITPPGYDPDVQQFEIIEGDFSGNAYGNITNDGRAGLLISNAAQSWVLPRLSSRIIATLGAVSNFTLASASPTCQFGLCVSGGAYATYLNGNYTYGFAQLANIGDTLIIDQAGNAAELTVKNAAGDTIVGPVNQTLTLDGIERPVFNLITQPGLGALNLTNVNTQFIQSQIMTYSKFSLSTTIANYLGFTPLQFYSAEGVPAIITADYPANPDLQFNRIYVCTNTLGLATHFSRPDGLATKVNILGSIPLSAVEGLSDLEYQAKIEEPVLLIDGRYKTISTFNAYFTTDSKTGAANITFNGSPSVKLLFRRYPKSRPY